MIELFYDIYMHSQLGTTLSAMFSFSTVVVLSILTGYLTTFCLEKMMVPRVTSAFRTNATAISDIIAAHHLFHRLLLFIIPVLVLLLLPKHLSPSTNVFVVPMSVFVGKVTTSYLIVLLGIFINTLLNTGMAIYNLYPLSKLWPIKTYIQFLKVLNCITFTVFVVCYLINQSPLAFFTGLGAMMAIVLLVFKDSILAFVSSLQISASQMLHVGDWVEIPERGINGIVIDMSLNTVKIQNYDKTISTLPPYYMTANSIKNWRGMYDAGGRLIKRSLFLDFTSIKFVDAPLLEDLKTISLLKPYIDAHPDLISTTTNVELLRTYIELYISSSDLFWHDNFTYMARLMDGANGGGLPLEVFVFTKETTTKDYEHIQSALFEHLIALLPRFQLKIYQLT